MHESNSLIPKSQSPNWALSGVGHMNSLAKTSRFKGDFALLGRLVQWDEKFNRHVKTDTRKNEEYGQKL